MKVYLTRVNHLPTVASDRILNHVYIMLQQAAVDPFLIQGGAEEADFCDCHWSME